MAIPETELFRRHTAYHQAGHVIADLVSGYRFTFVTIRPDVPGEEDGAVCGNARGRARDLAGMSVWEFHDTLAREGIERHYDTHDLGEDIKTLRDLG